MARALGVVSGDDDVTEVVDDSEGLPTHREGVTLWSGLDESRLDCEERRRLETNGHIGNRRGGVVTVLTGVEVG